jgi:hypothetical protein
MRRATYASANASVIETKAPAEDIDMAELSKNSKPLVKEPSMEKLDFDGINMAAEEPK